MFYVVLFSISMVIFVPSQASSSFDEVKILFFYGANTSNFEIYSLTSTDQISEHESFNKKISSTLYIHGYRENYTSESVQTVVKAFLKRKTHNILVLDWSEYANGNYVTNAVPNLIRIGRLMGRTIYSMLMDRVIDINQLHMIGHSLGGQLAGYIGRWIIALSRNRMRVKRITALDPAGPLFYNKVFFPTYLSFLDAEFVDIIHTDAGTLGTSFSSGTVDFWPNSGSSQLGCYRFENHICDHSRSWQFFAESVERNEKFYAIKCKDYEHFKNSTCAKPPLINYMGMEATAEPPGNFYLQTNPKYPFCRGEKGVKHNETLVIEDKKSLHNDSNK